jgi:hypothetical protein
LLEGVLVNAIKAAGTLPGLIWAVTRMVWWRLPDVLVRSEVPFDASPNTGLFCGIGRCFAGFPMAQGIEFWRKASHAA